MFNYSSQIWQVLLSLSLTMTLLIHLLHWQTRVVSKWDYNSEHSSSSVEANVLLRSWNSWIWNMNITSTLPFYTIITPQPSSIPKLHVMLAHLTYPEVVACAHELCKISISVVTFTFPTTFLTWSHPSHLGPIQGMINQISVLLKLSIGC